MLRSQILTAQLSMCYATLSRGMCALAKKLVLADAAVLLCHHVH